MDFYAILQKLQKFNLQSKHYFPLSFFISFIFVYFISFLQDFETNFIFINYLFS